MKVRFIVAGAVLALGAFAAAQAVAEDQHHDEHHAAPQGQQQHGGPPPGGHAPQGGHPGGTMGGPPLHGTMSGPPGGTMSGPSHNNMTGGQGQMQGPGRGQMMMGGHNRTINNSGNGRPNFDRHTYQRNFTAPRHYHIGVYARPQGWYAHRWVYGETLPAIFWTQNYWLTSYYDYGLADPPPGFVWVRYGDDALLIDQYSGEVLQVEYSVFD